MNYLPTTAPDTGNPGLNSLVWRAAIGLSGLLTGVILAWLNAKGFATTDITILGEAISPSVLVGSAVLSILLAAFGVFWGWFKGTELGAKIESIKIAGVTAGINLTAVGNAIAVATANGALVAKPVTIDAANAIIERYGPHAPAPSFGSAPPGSAIAIPAPVVLPEARDVR